MQTFGAEHDGAQVHLVVGERFILALAEKPSTGYRWDTERSYDGVLERLRDAYNPAPDSRGRLGSGGTREWLYEAAAPGTCTLTLRLRRPWQPTPQAETMGSYSLAITVTPLPTRRTTDRG